MANETFTRKLPRLQKTKIPARGLKLNALRASAAASLLQKTKIPARGLKHRSDVYLLLNPASFPSKNQNPREGIETKSPITPNDANVLASKNQNPREGIETPIAGCCMQASTSILPSKNQNPREGIET